MTRQIKPVQDNNDKCQTFAYWKSRYKLAMNYGFYVEALVIDYALLEDRLKSFLFHIGVFNTRKSYKADNKKVKPDLYKILTFNHEKNELRVNSIQGKKRFEIFQNKIQMLVFDARVDYHTNGNLETYTKGNHFGSAYFCRDFLPSKLELRKLNKYEKELRLNKK